MVRPTAALSLRALVLVAVTCGAAWAQGPPRAEVVPLVETDGVHAGQPVRVALQVRLPEGFHVQSDAPRDPSLIATVLAVDAPDGVSVDHLIFPTPTDLAQEGQDVPLAVFEHAFVMGAVLQVDSAAAEGDLRVPGRLRYQACDDKACFLPVTVPVEWTLRIVPASTPLTPMAPEVFAKLDGGRTAEAPDASAIPAPRAARPAPPSETNAVARLDDFVVRGSTGGYMGAESFLQFISDAEQGVVSRGLFDGRGPLAIVLLILVGGLALNLTPCVLPMIPINLAVIGAGAQSGSRRRGLLLGSAYGGAMALVYGVLGLVVVMTAGTFGTINASPWFNLGIAVLFIALSLAMFDVFVIDFSSYASGVGTHGSRGSLALAFTMGAVAALLAGACVAPVVIQVILLAGSLYANGTPVALALPFFLGVGMALPWPFAGAGLAALPKPGRWMVHVKHAFGVFILVTAAYYGYVAYTLFANRWVDPAAVAGSVQEKLEQEGWTSSLAGGLAEAQASGKPVLIDFWATWCKNCLTMDETTLEDPAVTAALADYVKIKVQAEDPDSEPARTMMARFNAVGLPTYVILQPGATEQSRR